MDSCGAKGRVVMPEKENKSRDEKSGCGPSGRELPEKEDKSKEKETVSSCSPPSDSPLEPVHEAAGASTLANQHGAAKKSTADLAEAASPVELVQETAPASSTPMNQQIDVDSAVAGVPSSIGDGSASPESIRRSVVTVATVASSKHTVYGTGFILVSERNYSVIFSAMQPGSAGKKKHNRNRYYVYFEGDNKVEATELVIDRDHMFMILIAQTDEEYLAVNFRNDPPGYELVFTVGTMSGTKLHAEAKARVVDQLIGHLGIYKGEVITPSCAAVNLNNRPEDGSAMFFELTCNVHDHIVTLEDIDNDRRRYTATIVRSAPVFSLSNEVVGIIYSHGTWHDVKVGLLGQSVIKLIQKMCNGDNWKDALKKAATHSLSSTGKRRMIRRN